MKRILRPALFAALAFGASTASLLAQAPSPSPHGSPDGPPPPHHGPPPSPLFDALDTNHDGVLSADEIANAPAALQKLAGASGQITRESVRPQRRDGDHPQPADRRGGPAKDDSGRHGPPPPDAQDSPSASPSPDSRHAPDGRHHGPPPDGERHEDAASSPGASPAGSPPSGPDGKHHGPPHGGPLFDALDTNHDGTISAAEIANATASLKALDKKGAGQITREDLRPPGPPPRHDD